MRLASIEGTRLSSCRKPFGLRRHRPEPMHKLKSVGQDNAELFATLYLARAHLTLLRTPDLQSPDNVQSLRDEPTLSCSSRLRLLHPPQRACSCARNARP
jgi:hypothetical protein